MEKINCVGCKWLRVDKYSCAHYCQITKEFSHRETVHGSDTLYSPIIPDNGNCPGWVSEIPEASK